MAWILNKEKAIAAKRAAAGKRNAESDASPGRKKWKGKRVIDESKKDWSEIYSQLGNDTDIELSYKKTYEYLKKCEFDFLSEPDQIRDTVNALKHLDEYERDISGDEPNVDASVLTEDLLSGLCQINKTLILDLYKRSDEFLFGGSKEVTDIIVLILGKVIFCAH